MVYGTNVSKPDHYKYSMEDEGRKKRIRHIEARNEFSDKELQDEMAEEI
jgi:hypothetical protein